jgi:hypothetical protein
MTTVKVGIGLLPERFLTCQPSELEDAIKKELVSLRPYVLQAEV